MSKRMTKEERVARFPPLQFECAWCHGLVSTDSTERLDKRTRFCCAKCERQYWRKVTRHPTHLTNGNLSAFTADVDRYSHRNEREFATINMMKETTP